MRIGLDLSVIQTPHRMRGIGATAINFINNISPENKKAHEFIIYLYEDGRDEALQILNLRGINYEVRTLEHVQKFKLRLPGRLKIINGLVNHCQQLIRIFFGDDRIRDLSELDAFLQFEQMSPLPKAKNLRTGVILYDIIPYVLGSEYLWSYKIARANNDSRKSALRKEVHRRLYKFKTKAVARSADVLLAISEHTKNDFVKYFGIQPDRIDVVHLGVTFTRKAITEYPYFKKYVENSWGYLPKPVDLRNKPFLLFVGGADSRRRLNDLVAAFNNLRAEGVDMRLVFAGDSMKGPYAIPILHTQRYIASSSYLDDIVFLGFITDQQKDWLYNHATAFVYPSVYEGFGLPVLEAMCYGTPVITYRNSSIEEVAGRAALYASDAVTIKSAVDELLERPALRERYAREGKKQASKYPWDKTVTQIIDRLTS